MEKDEELITSARNMFGVKIGVLLKKAQNQDDIEEIFNKIRVKLKDEELRLENRKNYAKRFYYLVRDWFIEEQKEKVE